MKHQEYIRKHPQADTVVLMIHGIVGTPRHFDAFLSAVPEQVDICNMRLPGHGGTVLDFAHASMAQWKRAVHDRLAALSEEYDHILILAHSMGCLLSISALGEFPKLRGMVLLAPPLKVGFKPVMIKYSMKLVFGCINENDPAERGIRDAAGVTQDLRLWRYLGWIPRFIELLTLCRRTRKEIPGICVPCRVLLSRKDELVSLKTRRYLEGNPSVSCAVLPDSGHFFYSDEACREILKSIGQMISPFFPQKH